MPPGLDAQEKNPLGGTRREKMHGQQYTKQSKMIKNDKKLVPYVAKRVKADSLLFSGRADKRSVCALKSILDSSFKYTHSSATDVRKTFARLRLEQQAQVGQDEHAQIRPTASVTKVIVRRAAQPAS